jgi:hypothetical protein
MHDHDARHGSDHAFPSGGARPAPGRATLTSRLAPPREAPQAPATPVQRAETAAPSIDPFALHLAAEHGVAGASSPLPYHDDLRASFGRHGAALDGARAQIGGPAAGASETIGARAYATGDRVAFASAPDRALAAHEAAHIVQQRAGVSLSGGVGAAGDPYERHADEVAAAFARGESAEPILDRMPTGGGSTVQRAVQRKEEPGPDPDDAAPADAPTPAVENPTFNGAMRHIDEWYQFQYQAAQQFIGAQEDAFERFKLYSNHDFSGEGSSGMSLLDLALLAVPAAASLKVLLSEIRAGLAARKVAAEVRALAAARDDLVKQMAIADRFPSAYTILRKNPARAIEKTEKRIGAAEKKLASAEASAGRTKTSAERIQAGADVAEVGKDVAEKHEAAAARAQGSEDAQLQLKVIDSLDELKTDGVSELQARHRSLQLVLEGCRYTAPNWNLEQYVRQILVSSSPAELRGQGAAFKTLALQFELQLYVARYVETHEAEWHTEHNAYYDLDNSYLRGVPPAVLARVKEIPGGEIWFSPGNPSLRRTQSVVHRPGGGHDLG